MVVPRYLPGIAGQGDVAKCQRSDLALAQMTAAQVERTGVMVALDPYPFAPGLEPPEPLTFILRQLSTGFEVIETVTKAYDGSCARALDLRFKPGERVTRFDWREHWPAASHDTPGLAQM